MSRTDDLRAGDWVEVKNQTEIAETLSAEGTLDNLPFMPEMLEHCSRRFRVLRRAEKTCVELAGGRYVFNEFCNNNVVLLEGLRCSGAAHDGCGRACVLFWKADWLRKVDGPQAASDIEQVDRSRFLSRLKTKSAPDRYFCQSTELAKATLPMSRSRILVKCFYDVRSGSRGLFEMIWIVLRALWNKPFFEVRRPTQAGSLTRTPVGTLNLQPGELVKIKPLDEIVKTLDRNGRNRGLRFDLDMCRLRGLEYRIRNRLDRMIVEGTGEMREVQSTVVVEKLECLCLAVVGGCPRQDFMYWREVWLERASLNEDN